MQLRISLLIQNNQILGFPKEAKVKRVIDGDTIELANGQIVRIVGVNAPNNNEKFEEEATEFTKKLVEGKKVKLEYDSYKSDRFGRILAYVLIDNKNLNIELVKRGLARVTVYEKRKPLIYQNELIQAQNKAKRNKLGLLSEDDGKKVIFYATLGSLFILRNGRRIIKSLSWSC